MAALLNAKLLGDTEWMRKMVQKIEAEFPGFDEFLKSNGASLAALICTEERYGQFPARDPNEPFPVLEVLSQNIDVQGWMDATFFFLDTYGDKISLSVDQEGQTRGGYGAFINFLTLPWEHDRTYQLFQKMIAIDPQVVYQTDPSSGNTALHYALQGGNYKIIEDLLEKHNLNPKTRNKYGENPLVYMLLRIENQIDESMEKWIEILLMLTCSKEDIDETPFVKILTCLEQVIYYSFQSKGIIRFLIEKFYGREVNSKYPLVRRFLDSLDDTERNNSEIFENFLLLHDKFESRDEIQKYPIYSLLCSLDLLRSNSFKNQAKMAIYYEILWEIPQWLREEFQQFQIEHDKRMKWIKPKPNIEKFQFNLFYIPPKEFWTPEVAQTMTEVLEKLHEKDATRFEEIIKGFFQYAELHKKDLFGDQIIDPNVFAVFFSFLDHPEAVKANLDDFKDKEIRLTFIPKRLLNKSGTVPDVMLLGDFCRMVIGDKP